MEQRGSQTPTTWRWLRAGVTMGVIVLLALDTVAGFAQTAPPPGASEGAEASIAGQAAPSPVALSPAGDQMVTSRSGLIPVRWQPLPDASTYGYEAEFNAFGSWTGIGKAQGVSKSDRGSIKLDKYFIRQYGAGVDMRWHVWVVGRNGKRGATSAWATFRYTYGQGKYTFRDNTLKVYRKRQVKKAKKRAPSKTQTKLSR